MKKNIFLCMCFTFFLGANQVYAGYCCVDGQRSCWSTDEVKKCEGHSGMDTSNWSCMEVRGKGGHRGAPLCR